MDDIFEISEDYLEKKIGLKNRESQIGLLQYMSLVTPVGDQMIDDYENSIDKFNRTFEDYAKEHTCRCEVCEPNRDQIVKCHTLYNEFVKKTMENEDVHEESLTAWLKELAELMRLEEVSLLARLAIEDSKNLS